MYYAPLVDCLIKSLLRKYSTKNTTILLQLYFYFILLTFSPIYNHVYIYYTPYIYSFPLSRMYTQYIPALFTQTADALSMWKNISTVDRRTVFLRFHIVHLIIQIFSSNDKCITLIWCVSVRAQKYKWKLLELTYARKNIIE